MSQGLPEKKQTQVQHSQENKGGLEERLKLEKVSVILFWNHPFFIFETTHTHEMYTLVQSCVADLASPPKHEENSTERKDHHQDDRDDNGGNTHGALSPCISGEAVTVPFARAGAQGAWRRTTTWDGAIIASESGSALAFSRTWGVVLFGPGGVVQEGTQRIGKEKKTVKKGKALQFSGNRP